MTGCQVCGSTHVRYVDTERCHERAVLKVWQRQAREEGKTLAKYLHEAGILTEYEQRQIRNKERSFYPNEQLPQND